MTFEIIEHEALCLPEAERAKLAQKRLLSLDAHGDRETEQQWRIEADRRARELDSGKVKPVPAEEVRRKARALLR